MAQVARPLGAIRGEPGKRVTVNGRLWEVGDDGTLRDRRETPQDGVRLNAEERTVLQLLLVCDAYVLPVLERSPRLAADGLVTDTGLLTPAGRALAVRLLGVN